MGGGHNNSGNSVGVQQKSSMMDKLKNVFSSKKEVDQRTESDQNLVSQPQQQYHFQPAWNVVPDVNMAYDIRIQQDSRRRKSFAEKEREEQALRAEEEILLERERRSTARLESLLEAVKAHARRESWLKIMQQELRDALHIVHKIRRAWDRTPGRVNKLREEYQDKLEHIYQLGEKYLTAEGEEAEYAELIKDVMEASDDAQLPSSRILLIRKERQYRKEDEKGYEHALQDHEVKQLDKETIEAIEYYTSAPPVHDGKSWYQYMNQFLRGLLPNGNKLPEENGVKETVLKMINRLGNAFQGKQKETKRVYRGLNLRDVFKEKIDQPESLVGAVYSDKGYLSTSRQRKKSVDFLQYSGVWYSAVQRFIEIRQKNPQAPPPEKFITGHSLLEITAREGAHGLDIEDVTQVAGEEEILFPPGTRVYLHSMQMSNCRITVSREDFVKAVGNRLSPQEMERIFPSSWNAIYINVQVPVFQGEIR